MNITFNNITAQIEFEFSKEEEIWRKIVAANKVKAPGSEFAPAFKAKKWDGKVSILGLKSFPTGLLPLVKNWLWEEGQIIPTLIDARLSITIDPDAERISIKLRPYQMDALNAGITNEFNNMWWPRGVFSIATGGGKTELAIAMYQFLGIPSVFLVDNRHLVNQTTERFRANGVDAGMLGDGVHDIRPNGITVCTVQTILSFLRNDRQSELAFLKNVKQVFFDEAHMIAANVSKGNEFYKVSQLLSNAYCRWGLTATPFMKDQYSNWLLYGTAGSELYKISNSSLIEQGYLTPPEIYVQEMPKVRGIKNEWPDCYDLGIVLNQYRNEQVIGWLKNVPKPCLIFTNQTPHAKILSRMAEEEGLECPMLDYKSKTEARQAVLDKLASGELEQAVVTKIFDQGMDLPNFRSLIFAGGGKSLIKNKQKIGRGLRKASGKDKIYVVDFYDCSTKILERHSNQRLELWKDEGFNVTRTNKVGL